MSIDPILSRLASFEQTDTFHAVVVRDDYRLQKLWFAPDVIYDVGASQGMFTVFARKCFPDARIVAVEPHPDNWTVLQATVKGLPNIECVNAALGTPPIYYREGKDPGKHGFVSRGIGYSSELLRTATGLRESNVKPITLGRLVNQFGGKKYLIKIDVEGAEQTLFGDPAAKEAITQSTYTTMELHLWAGKQADIQTVTATCLAWIAEFRLTHLVELNLWHSAGMAWISRHAEVGA